MKGGGFFVGYFCSEKIPGKIPESSIYNDGQIGSGQIHTWACWDKTWYQFHVVKYISKKRLIFHIFESPLPRAKCGKWVFVVSSAAHGDTEQGLIGLS